MKRTLTKNRGWGAWATGAITSLLALSALGQLTPPAAGPIAIPDFPQLPSQYPSVIKVTGATGALEKVTVTLNTLTHTYANDVEVMLVAPNGNAVVLMSGAGGGQPLGGVSLLFDDEKGTVLPRFSAIQSGAYRPTNYSGATLTNAPVPTGTTLRALTNSSPNGDWKLYVVDDAPFNQGSLGSWTVNLYTTPLLFLATNNVYIQEGGSGTVEVVVEDSSSTGDALTFSAVSTDTGLIPASGLTFTGTGKTRTLRITPGFLQAGTNTVTVTVADELGFRSSATLTVNVSDVNQRPEVALNVQSVTVVAGSIATNLIAFPVDLDLPSPSSLVLSATSSDNAVVAPGGVTFATNPPNARPFSIVPTTTTGGSATLTITVSDGKTNNSTPLLVNVLPSPQPLFANFSAINTASSPANSSITVPTIAGNIGRVEVSLNGVRQLNPNTLGIALVSPHGTITLFNGSASTTPVDIGQLTFRDGATGAFPATNTTRNVTLAPVDSLATLANKTANGTWTLWVTNGGAASQIAAGWQIKVFPAPTIGPIATLRIEEDTSGQVNFTVADLDGTVTNVTAAAVDATLMRVVSAGVTGNNAQVTIAGNENRFGTNDVIVTAVDNMGQAATRTFRVEIVAVNDRPDISFIEKQITYAGQPVGPVSFTITDVDTAADTLTVTATSDNPKVLPDSNIVISRNGNDATFTLFPIGITPGQANVTITVSDGNLSDSSTFTLYVQEPANPLYLNNTPIVINPNTNATPYPSTNIVAGLVGRLAEVQVTLLNFTHQAPRDVNVLLVGPNSNSVVLMAKVGGTNQVNNVTLVFTDAATNSLNETNLISGVYDPTVGPGTITFPAPAIAPTHTSLAAAFNGIDPNGTWRLFVADDAIGKSFGAINGGWLLSIRTSPFIPAIGAQTMTENTPKRVEVIVGDLQPGVSFEVTATAADPTLILPIGVSTTGATRTLLITNAPYAFGSTIITVTARDNLGNEFVRTFPLTVQRVDLPPVVSAIANTNVPAAQLIGPIVFTAWTPQADRNLTNKVDVTSDNPALFPAGSITVIGPILTNAVTPVADARTFVGGTNTFALLLQPAGIQTGTANIFVTVSDNFGQKTTVTFRVTVTPSLVYAYEKPIEIPLGLPIEGEAIPYPAIIPVSNLEGAVQNVRVTLVGFNHTYPDDVNILLVSPAPENVAVVLMAHAGSSNDVSNARITFSEEAGAQQLPNDLPITSGTYLPSAYSPVTFPAPAPQSGYKFALSDFRGATPNGDWKVYVLDDAFPDRGSISGGVLLFIDTKPTFKPIGEQTSQENAVWPVALNIANSSVNPSNLVITATASGQDPAGLVQNIAITGFGSARTLWITNAPNQPSASFSPTVKNGTATITVRATDPVSGVFSETTFKYNVVYVNQAPQFTQFPTGIQLQDESSTNRITIRIMDVDSPITNAPLVYSTDTTLIPNNKANLDVEGFTSSTKGNEAQATIKIAPAKFKFGTNTITVVVNDGTGANNKWITNTITIGVRSVWENPTISKPADASIVAGTSTTNITFTVGSNDVDPATLRVFATSGNKGIIPDRYITIGGSGTARTIRVTSIGTIGGVVPINVTVTDDKFGTNVVTFNVTVTAPSGTTRPAQYANTSELTFNGTAKANTYPTFIEVPQIGNEGRISKVSVLLDGLTHTIPANLDVMLVHPDGTTAVMLMSGAGDAVAISNPIRITFDDSGAPLPLEALTEGTYHPGTYTKRLLPDAPTNYSVNLDAFNGLAANGVWRLYVNNNGGTGSLLAGWALRITTGPVINISGTSPSPIVIQENGSATVTLNIRDDFGTAANGFVVTPESSNPLLLPTRNITTGDANNLTQTWTLRPELYQSGEATVTFNVRRISDGATARVVLSPNVVVNPVNVPPTFSRIPDVTINANETGTAQFLVMDGDTPLQDLIITATSENQAIVRDVNLRFNGKTNTLYGLPASAVPQTSLLNLSISPELTAVGTTRVVLTVTDPAKVGTNVVQAFLWLTVNQYLVPPVISSVPPQTIASGAAIDNIAFWVSSPIPGATFTVTGSASPNLFNEITATPVSGNATNWTLRLVAADVITDETPRTSTVTLTATANNGAKATTSFVVTLIPKRERAYTNTTPIVINDNGPATPYPSTIKVDELMGAVKEVKVRLNGFTHTFPSDVAVLLVSPAGQKVVLMNRAGQGGGPVNGINLTFDQNASQAIPGSTTLSSGTWRPADYRAGSYNFLSPAPAAPYSNTLAAISGAAAGTWSLYVMDDMLGDSGVITNGWTLMITTQPIINGLANQYLLEGTSATQAFTIADDTRSANPTYQISATSSRPDVIPVSGITFGGSGTNRTVTVTPSTYGSNVVVTVFVTNGDGQNVSRQFSVDVGYNLTAPVVAAIPDAGVNAGSVFTTALNFSDAHTALNQLAVGVASSNQELVPASSIKRLNITNLWIAPVGNLSGTTTITLSVTNNDGLFTQRSFVLTVNPSPTPLFANTNRIVIRDLAAADPYPSTITVSGLSGTITKATVTINGLQHTFPQDISMLLGSPSGTNVVLMSRAGGALAVNNVRITFDDAATSPVPQSGTLTDGSYRPSDYKASDVYRPGAPAAPYSKVLSDLIGTDPNGTWSLFVQDDATPDVGAINGGWTLSLTTTAGKAIVLGGRNATLVISQMGDDLQLTVNGTPGVEYGIQTSNDMSTWTEAGSVTAGDNGTATYTIKPATNGLQLFRAVAK